MARRLPEALGHGGDDRWIELAARGHGPAAIAAALEELAAEAVPPEALDDDPLADERARAGAHELGAHAARIAGLVRGPFATAAARRLESGPQLCDALEGAAAAASGVRDGGAARGAGDRPLRGQAAEAAGGVERAGPLGRGDRDGPARAGRRGPGCPGRRAARPAAVAAPGRRGGARPGPRRARPAARGGRARAAPPRHRELRLADPRRRRAAPRRRGRRRGAPRDRPAPRGRVPGHRPPAVRDRRGSSRWRARPASAPGCSWSATRSSRSTAGATPTSRRTGSSSRKVEQAGGERAPRWR